MQSEQITSADGRPLVIVGGGLAGSLAALALASRRPAQPLLLVEGGARFGGNHIWSFFDGDVEEEHAWLIEPLVKHHWPDHEVYFPRRKRRLGFGYNSIRSEDLHRRVLERLGPDQWRLGQSVVDVSETEVFLSGGERIEAAAVLDARGAEHVPNLELGWQKFLGRTFRFEAPHGVERPTIMDACVEQSNGYRFVYLLPFSSTELLVEDTYYSDGSALDLPLLRHRIDGYMARRGWAGAALAAEEVGALPIPIDGSAESFWPEGPRVGRLGLRGGFFHPTTGYSLPDAVANAASIARMPVLTTAALHDALRNRSLALWRERSFYRKLNKMLFRAAAPSSRYRILEHFYRLGEPSIRRFYAGRLSWLDKVRILSGRPPIKVSRGLAALRARPA